MKIGLYTPYRHILCYHIELNKKKRKSGIDHSRPNPFTLAFEPWRLTQHMVTHWEPAGLEPCHRSTPLTG